MWGTFPKCKSFASSKASHFGNVPHLQACPIVKFKANVITKPKHIYIMKHRTGTLVHPLPLQQEGYYAYKTNCEPIYIHVNVKPLIHIHLNINV
jgi:hypothetical protein